MVDDFDPEELILNCYRLADRFHQSPEHFLSMQLSEIDRHVYYTVMLTKKQREATRPVEDDD